MTRLPLYSRGTSFPLVMAIAGPLMILPNVGLNEWGFMEELFSAPLHWGFVILALAWTLCGWNCGADHYPLLQPDRVVWNNQSKVILNNRIVSGAFGCFG